MRNKSEKKRTMNQINHEITNTHKKWLIPISSGVEIVKINQCVWIDISINRTTIILVHLDYSSHSTCKISQKGVHRHLLWQPDMATIIIMLFKSLTNSLDFISRVLEYGKTQVMCRVCSKFTCFTCHIPTHKHTYQFVVYSKKLAKINKLINQTKLQWHLNKSAKFTVMEELNRKCH